MSTANQPEETQQGGAAPPLTGVKVVDAATLFAGPLAATILGDFGADVIKIEHPKGDPVRWHGHSKDGVPLWWKVISRNKRAITLNFSRPEGQELLLDLIADADVLIENFRPGTLERWNLGWGRLHAHNPKLVLLRMTGFGQFGPYAHRPGFGTLAESMSGFAHITGQPDSTPTLPPFGLADGIAGLAGAIATMMCLYNRNFGGGQGQVVDLAIIEPILSILGPQPTVFDQLGIIQTRTGNRSGNNAPRNTYRTGDGRWVAISTSAQSIAERVMRLVGHSEVIEEPWFKSGAERAKHADTLDAMVGGWIAEHSLEDVVKAFEEAEAAVAPIYDVSDIMRDPQYQALQSIVTIPDDELGPIKMQNVLFRLSQTPGRIRWAGRRLGQDNEEVYGALGFGPERLAQLREQGVI
ncbi:MAG: CoA transferase [Chloroflexota bacterium]|nr:MAG: CoA transferase [Chloroflexota bacterium]